MILNEIKVNKLKLKSVKKNSKRKKNYYKKIRADNNCPNTFVHSTDFDDDYIILHYIIRLKSVILIEN